MHWLKYFCMQLLAVHGVIQLYRLHRKTLSALHLKVILILQQSFSFNWICIPIADLQQDNKNCMRTGDFTFFNSCPSFLDFVLRRIWGAHKSAAFFIIRLTGLSIKNFVSTRPRWMMRFYVIPTFRLDPRGIEVILQHSSQPFRIYRWDSQIQCSKMTP